MDVRPTLSFKRLSLHIGVSQLATDSRRRVHLSADRRAAAILLTAIVPIVLCVLGSSLEAHASFPNGPHPMRFNNDFGWMDVSAAQVQGYDVFSTSWYNCEGETAASVDSLKMLNPEMLRLVYFNPLLLAAPNVSNPDHIVNRFLNQIQPEWYMRNTAGELVYLSDWPDAPLMNLSDRCPRAGGETWPEFCARFVAEEVIPTGLWEGVLWDNSWSWLSWADAILAGEFDLDLNGVPDHPDSVDAWWYRGLEQMHAAFRSTTHPNLISIGNGDALIHQYLNGRYYEGFPREGWTEGLLEADDWHANSVQPTMLIFSTQGNALDHRLIRFGICSSLLAGGMFWHEPDGPPPFLNLYEYDELAVDLGQVQGDRYEIGIDYVATIDLESGTPEGLDLGYWNGVAYLTTQPALVISGTYSVVGEPLPEPSAYNTFMTTIPAEIPLLPNRTYTLEFDYKIVEEAPNGGAFYASARSSASSASERSVINFSGPAGTSGHARAEFTTGPWSDYFVYFGMQNGGRIVMDNIQLLEGHGGVFRRDFDNGIALANPGNDPKLVELEDEFYFIEGEMNPGTNTGQPVSNVWLDPQDGLVLLRRSPSGVENPPGGPGDGGGNESPVPVPMAYPNPVVLSQSTTVSIQGIPENGSVQIYGVDGRLVQLVDEVSVAGLAVWDVLDWRQRAISPGVYFAVVRDATQSRVRTLKITLAR